MRPRGGSVGPVLTAALAAVLLAPLGVADAQEDEDGQPVDLGRYRGPIRLEAGGGTTFELADGRRFVDTLEVRTAADGPVLVNELGIESYVAGIAEMPAQWPLEALKAQAVAARTYAWWQARRDSFDGYDICATVACQVFDGAGRTEVPVLGGQWREAVEDTAGEVLLFERAPILARYFSTSGGRTYANDDVFPESEPQPYLQGVEDPDDAVSPLHRWTARFSREQLDAILDRGDTLSDAVPVASVERLDRAGVPDDRIRVTGRDGGRATVTAGTFREFVSRLAPELFPRVFPGPREDGDDPLPTTLPSSRFEVEVGEDTVVISGRGWGHGVGMGQYGARGKAERGLAYDEILAAYYGGLTPRIADGLPDRIRVGLSMDRSLTVQADGPFRVVSGDDELVQRGLGAWEIRAAADGTLAVTGPPGFGAPLVVAPTEASRARPTHAEVVTLETVVNKTSELVLEVRRGDQQVLQRDLGVVEPGRHVAVWSLDDAGGETVAPGAYRARLVASDETGETAGEATRIRVRAVTAAARPLPSALGPAPAGAGRPLAALLVALALGALVGAGVGRALRR